MDTRDGIHRDTGIPLRRARTRISKPRDVNLLLHRDNACAASIPLSLSLVVDFDSKSGGSSGTASGKMMASEPIDPAERHVGPGPFCPRFWHGAIGPFAGRKRCTQCRRQGTQDAPSLRFLTLLPSGCGFALA